MVKLFKEALFNRKTLNAALARAAPEPTPEQLASAATWAADARDKFFRQNESQLEQRFNAEILQTLLGYRPFAGGIAGTFKPKVIIGPREVDVAIGSFDGVAERIVAPIELKGPRVELDKIMSGRAKTPVQQAWEYAADAPGSRWVLVCNMLKLRLYAFGQGTARYEEFDLDSIDNPDELKLLLLLCSADSLLGTATADLLARSAGEDRDITNQLYRDYRDLRQSLMQFVADQRKDIAPEPRIALVQKILDRLVFIAYAEDTVLLPDNRLKLAVEHDDPFQPRPKWDNVKALFAAVDTGNERLGITGYNGGLFAPDPLVDGLALPDHLVVTFLKLAAYDFKSEISVTILGHLFEQTIGDIEADLLVARGEAPAPGLKGANKKKRDGIVYTPDFVTRFIVEQTLGKVIAEIRAELLATHAKAIDAEGNIAWNGAEAAYWQALLARLKTLTLIDPACGSGHFLVAAFDYLAAETKAANDRLRELDPLAAEDTALANAHIITRNLYGVDLNAESVEITRLSLWLKTAQPRQPLTTLDHNIRVGNSIIADKALHPRGFDWDTAFPEIKAAGGFALVVGNPPYVRMELLKPIKPYLEAHYAVASDRADLYAYFFELGVRLLQPGGRLGFISSSTFFKTGSGAPLRQFLTVAADLEAVIDFGDTQLFEGVTTYPAILTMRKRVTEAEAAGDLRFLNLKAIPDDLGKAFDTGGQPMPRARLGSGGGWQFESDRLAALRARMAAGRQTLAQAYGAPLYGIKTGLNEAFVLTRAQRDALVAADAGSADLLKPFLIGENLKRWHVESDDLWLIYTPKNRIAIDDYPAVRDHLAPFRERLEARATKQNWWELQQAQAAFEDAFNGTKIGYCDITNTNPFAIVEAGTFLANTVYFLPVADLELLAYLNSKVAWLHFTVTSNLAQGGYLRLRTEFVQSLVVPTLSELSAPAGVSISAATNLASLVGSVQSRLGDIHPEAPALNAFAAWPGLSFAELRALLLK
ncbi:MAG: hypothetical protein RL490_2182, partial [Pseudomonadota bacterium]